MTAETNRDMWDERLTDRWSLSQNQKVQEAKTGEMVHRPLSVEAQGGRRLEEKQDHGTGGQASQPRSATS